MNSIKINNLLLWVITNGKNVNRKSYEIDSVEGAISFIIKNNLIDDNNIFCLTADGNIVVTSRRMRALVTKANANNCDYNFILQ